MRLFTAFCPAQRELHRGFCLLTGCRIRRAFIKNHDDVRAECTLNPHRLFRPHKNLCPVDRRAEMDALLRDFPHLAEAVNLEPSGVGQNRTLPVREIVQIPMHLNDFSPWPQPQVECITEYDLRTHPLEFFRSHGLDSSIGPDGHKRGCINETPAEQQLIATRFSIVCKSYEIHDKNSVELSIKEY